VFNDDQPAAKSGDAKVSGELDLSAEIIKTVSKSSQEQVTCRRVKEDHYRCNWWQTQNLAGYDNPAMEGLMVTTNRISKSSFLRVTRAANGGLKIIVISGDRSNR